MGEEKVVSDSPGLWHSFDEPQRLLMYNRCILSFGAGVIFGLFVAAAF